MITLLIVQSVILATNLIQFIIVCGAVIIVMDNHHSTKR